MVSKNLASNSLQEKRILFDKYTQKLLFFNFLRIMESFPFIKKKIKIGRVGKNYILDKNIKIILLGKFLKYDLKSILGLINKDIASAVLIE